MKRPYIFDFASKKKTVYNNALRGVYYSEEYEAAICTDAQKIIFDRYEYIPDYAGEIRDKENKVIEARFPNISWLAPLFSDANKYEAIKIDRDKLIAELKEGIKATKEKRRDMMREIRLKNIGLKNVHLEPIFRLSGETVTRYIGAEDILLMLDYDSKIDTILIFKDESKNPMICAHGEYCDIYIVCRNVKDNIVSLKEVSENIYYYGGI